MSIGTRSLWRRRLALGLLVVLGAVAASSRVDARSPTDALHDTFTDANRLLAHRACATERTSCVESILRIVERVFAFPDAAEMALGREWARRSSSERAEFTRLFAALLERSFVLAIATRASLATGIELHVQEEVIDGERATVRTSLAGRDGFDVPIDYHMIVRDGRWLIRDVALDGVSTVGNYQAQFSRILRTSPYEELLARVRARTEAMTMLTAGGDGPPVVDDGTAGADSRTAGVESRSASADRHVAVGDRVTGRDDRAVAGDRPVGGDAGRSFALDGERIPSEQPRVVAIQPTTDGHTTAERAAPARVDNHHAAGTPTPAKAQGSAPSTRPRLVASTSYWVQVGAFQSADTASRVVTKLRAQRFAARIVRTSGDEREQRRLSRVQVGPFPDRESAGTALRALEQHGFRPFVAIEPG
jgi:phospholipid transport system substrate-binding protein